MDYLKNRIAVARLLLGIAMMLLLVAGCRESEVRMSSASVESAPAPAARQAGGGTGRAYAKPSDAELRKRLSPVAYEVTQNAATEPPFNNEYWDNHEAGLYVDVTSGEPLFSSTDKFDSGTGWPSFTRPVEAERVITAADPSHGMIRTEVLSRSAQAHLGHLFDDGPPPARTRYCINSASLRFIPAAELASQGYAEYEHLFAGGGQPAAALLAPTADTANSCNEPAAGERAGCQASLEVAILAGGCFWGMEEILRQIPGVVSTEVGYTGGTTEEPEYEDVRGGDTGHAESVRVVFEPSKLSYEELLEKWFFRMHDPTTPNRQGNDVGTQYRSAIFVTSAAQREVAERVVRRVDESGKWDAPIVTEIVEAGPFTLAEDYHQDYLQRNPGGYTCHYLRE